VLGIEGGGSRKTIVAANSPGEPVLPIFSAEVDEHVLRVLHQIGQEALDLYVTKELAGELAAQREAGAGRSAADPLIIAPGVSLIEPVRNLGAIADIRRSVSGMTRGAKQFVRMQGGVTVSEAVSLRTRFPGRAPSLGQLEVSPGSGLSYPEMGRRLAATNVPDPQLMSLATALERGGGTAGPLSPHAGPLSEMNRILQVEGARSSAMVSGQVMLREQVAGGSMTFAHAFGKTGPDGSSLATGGGAFPASQRPAVRPMHGVARSIGFEPAETLKTSATRAQLIEQRRRQIEFAKDYVITQMRLLNMTFDDPERVEWFARSNFEGALRAQVATHFGLRGFGSL
jgi:hypothetical protein